MGRQKKDGGNGGGEKAAGGGGGEWSSTAVFEMELHCDGCARKVKRAINHIHGVEGVKTDVDSNQVTVTGKLDPAQIKARLEEKIKKNANIVSTEPFKGGSGQPKESTVVLKVILHCEGCISRIKRILKKVKGVEDVEVNEANELVTVKGTMDPEKLAPYLKCKIKREVEVIPPKKEEEKKEEEKPKEKEEKGKGNGPKMEYIGHANIAPSYWIDGLYGGCYRDHTVQPYHGYLNQMYMNQGLCGCNIYAPHQMFSDDNPCACFVM